MNISLVNNIANNKMTLRYTYTFLALRGVELEVEILRDGDEIGEFLGVCAELVEQGGQRGDEVRRHLCAIVAHHL